MSVIARIQIFKNTVGESEAIGCAGICAGGEGRKTPFNKLLYQRTRPPHKDCFELQYLTIKKLQQYAILAMILRLRSGQAVGCFI